MSDARQHSPKYYREKAREIRRFASRARSANVRLELLDIADRFDRMAAYVESRINHGEGGEEGLDRSPVRKPTPLISMPIEMGGHP